MSLLRDILLSKETIASRQEYKYAMLRGQFSLIITCIAIFYTLLDLLNGIHSFLFLYAILAGFSFLTIYLNRIRYYILSTTLSLISIDSLVYIFADSDHPYGGVFFFFLTNSIVGLILTKDYPRAINISFTVLPLIFAYLALFYDLNLIQPPIYKDGFVQISFFINIALAAIANAFVVYFVIVRNAEAEKSLLENEKRLLKTSADLRISEERFAMALEGTKAGIYEWRTNSNIIYTSPYWKKILGYENDELADLTFNTYQSFVHAEDVEKVVSLVSEKLKTNAPYQNEYRLRTKSGAYKWFQDNGMSKQNEEGNITAVVGSIIDIDERKRAEKELAVKNSQLAKTNEELDRFVYSASHDMRAPLSSLLGLIHLSEKTDRPEEIGTLLQMMKDRIKTMEGFIKEVTDYSRNTRLDLAPTQISLYDLVKEVVQNLAYTIVNKKVRISIEIEKDLVIESDVSRLKVVINNLLSNAYKYHQFEKPDPYIKISAKTNSEAVMIMIADNGQGIAPEHHIRIFEMFYRASESSEGSGLGLYIVKETLGKLRGDISMQSVLDEGTEFTVTLPL
jgi:PAS domain S-box-containing protein